MTVLSRAATAALAAALTWGCKKAEPPREEPSRAGPVLAASSGEEAFDLIRNVRNCDVKHRGILLDVGSRGVDAHREFAVGPLDDVLAEERGGATFGRVMTKRVGYQFFLDDDEKNVAVSLRGSGALSRYASVYIDDRRLGAVQLPQDDVRVVSLPPLDHLAKGPHTLVLRFAGTRRAPEDAYAFLDWIRIGVAEEDPKEYAAPTLRQLITDVVLDDRPKRSLVLRAPSTVRCALRVVPGEALKVSLGYWGNGKGIAEIRIVEDGEAPVTLREAKVGGGHGSAWTPVELPLDAFSGRVVAIELRATEASGGGRVAFGEPRVVLKPVAPERAPAAQVAVVLVGAGLDRRLVPPWGSAEGLTALSGLVRDAAVFHWHRVPTTVVSGVFSTLLTGLSPRAHGVEDPLARLPNDARGLGEMMKEAGGRAAMFTGVPMTFPAFGFDRGWDLYEWYSPVKDVPATEPLTRATAWLKEQLDRDPKSKHLVVVHLRGAHPPWDLNRDEAAKLAPEEYGGIIEPRRGAVVLAGIRGRRSRTERKLSTSDWTRLRELEVAAFRKQNLAMKQLFEVLSRRGLYDSSLIAFLGDVATGDAPHLPFSPTPELSEEHLVTPLIVKFPGRAAAGRRVGTLVTVVDLTRTIAESLELQKPTHFNGLDLYRVAGGFQRADGGPHTATLGSAYATRWGPWLLRGEVRRTPLLCQIEVDPACVHDLFAQNPIISMALWRQTFEAETEAVGSSARAFPREPATLDVDTEAALKVFGYGGG